MFFAILQTLLSLGWTTKLSQDILEFFKKSVESKLKIRHTWKLYSVIVNYTTVFQNQKTNEKKISEKIGIMTVNLSKAVSTDLDGYTFFALYTYIVLTLLIK